MGIPSSFLQVFASVKTMLIEFKTPFSLSIVDEIIICQLLVSAVCR